MLIEQFTTDQDHGFKIAIDSIVADDLFEPQTQKAAAHDPAAEITGHQIYPVPPTVVSPNSPHDVSRPGPVPNSVKIDPRSIEQIARNPSEHKTLIAIRELWLETGQWPTNKAVRKRASCAMATVELVRTRLMAVSSLGYLTEAKEPFLSYIFECLSCSSGAERQGNHASTGGGNRLDHAFTDGPLQEQLEQCAKSMFMRYPGQVHMLSCTLSASSEGAFMALALLADYAQERAIQLLCHRLSIPRDDFQYSLAWEISETSSRLLHFHAFIYAPTFTLTEDELRAIWLTVLDEVSSLTNVQMYKNADGAELARNSVNVHLHAKYTPPPIGKHNYLYHCKTVTGKRPRVIALLNGLALSPIVWGCSS